MSFSITIYQHSLRFYPLEINPIFHQLSRIGILFIQHVVIKYLLLFCLYLLGITPLQNKQMIRSRPMEIQILNAIKDVLQICVGTILLL